MSATACDRFDEHVEDLALGHLDEPLRSQLLAHASACPTCRGMLDGLGAVTDRLLELAPEAEPPAGFESRVLARIGTPSQPRRRHRWPAVAAAVALVTAGAAGMLALRAGTDDAPVAAIVTANDTRIGEVRLVADPEPHVLVTIDRPRPGPGVRYCELQLADGTWVEVGSWEVADIAAGVWAVGIDGALLDAAAMRITTADGDVLAVATF